MAGAYRESFRLAVPLILSNLTVPLLGMVDTAVVGRLDGPQYLAAVALGAAVMSMTLWCFGFLRIGTSGFTAQAFGRENTIEIKAILIRSLVMALLTGSAITALGPLLMHAAGWLYQIDGGLREGFESYLGIRLWGVPAMLANFVLIGWFLGQQNPYAPLIMMVVANSLNAALDIYFVLYAGMDVDGVALATVIADYSGLALGGCIALKSWTGMRIPNPGLARLLDLAVIGRFLSLGRDLFLRTLFMEFVFFGFTAIGARQGELMLAVNAVLMNFFVLQAHGLDGFSDATEAMVGRAVGRRRLDELREAFRAGLVNGILLTGLIALGFLIFGRTLVDILTTIEDVRNAAGAFLLYVALLPLVSVAAFICDGLYFGATRGADLRNALMVSSLVFAVAAFTLVPGLGNHGLWLAFLTFMAARGVTLLVIYRREGSGAGFIAGSTG